VTIARPGADQLTASILSVAAAIALALFSTAFTPLNTDLGWMLDFGRTAVTTGHLPLTNGRSFIDPSHPFISHEWAASVGFYLVHARWGAAGLIGMRWVAIIATVLMVGLTIRRTTGSALARLLALLLCAQALASAGGLQLIRAQLASIVLMAPVVHLALYGTRRSLWWCPLLFALWANLHGGWVAGGAALLVVCCARGLEQRMGWQPATVPDVVLVAVPAVSFAAVLLNPYGGALVRHTFHHVSDDIRLLNHEWLPLLTPGSLSGSERIVAGLLVGTTALIGVTVSPRRLAIWLLFLLGVVASFSASRNLRFAPILMAPAATLALARVDTLLQRARFTGARFVTFTAGALVVAFVLPLLGGGPGLFDFIDYKVANPGTALWVMRRNHLTGRLWSDFNWGGTILWVLPDTQIACDGRNVSAYSEDTLRASMLFGEARDPLAVLDQYGADMLLVPRKYTQLARVSSVFTPLYCDDDACVLSRKPEQLILARQGLVVPRRAVAASEFFHSPRADDVLDDPSTR
jgi:hypothetical protein